MVCCVDSLESGRRVQGWGGSDYCGGGVQKNGLNPRVTFAHFGAKTREITLDSKICSY